MKGFEAKDLNYLLAESNDPQNPASYKIHLKLGFPLILSMDLGWKIWLKEVK